MHELGTMDIRGVWPSRAVLFVGLHIGIRRTGTFSAGSALLLVAAASDRSGLGTHPVA
jgi:hypothetical protein